MYNLQIIENRIMSLAQKKKLTKNKLLLNAKLNKSVFDNMKKGQIPSVDKIHILADYLECSVDYLLGRTDIPEINKSVDEEYEYSRPLPFIAAYDGDTENNGSKIALEDIKSINESEDQA